MRILLVSSNAATSMGGEAIKAYQFFAYLLAQGYDAHLITHARCRDDCVAAFDRDRLHFVEDSALQTLLWRSRILMRFNTPLFHRAVARICRQFDPEDTLIHYLCPISPTVNRLPPSGFRTIVGPLSGNLFYPPAFAHRVGRKAALQKAIYRPLQLFSRLRGDLRKADRLLVSGYARTRAALRWAGCAEDRMMDVVDAGVSEAIADAPAMTHRGENGHFVWMGRFVDYKGADLAIKAVAQADPIVRLTLYGDGDIRPDLERLAQDLGVADRVHFAGWMPHDAYHDVMSQFRGFVFPTLAEANGIVMQEAMMAGLPVIALRWGGPEGLATDDEAVFVDPVDEAHVVAGFAQAMTRLARDPELAQVLSAAARVKAQNAFRWDQVAGSWTKAYAIQSTSQAVASPWVGEPKSS